MALRPAAFAEIIREWCGDLSGQHVAIDGKVLRGACDGATGRSMVHVLHAWVGEQGMSAEHVSCGQKNNELEALPRLLDALVLQGAIVSIDAMGTHSAIATQIHDSGADYMLALKANQKQALEAVAAHFNAADEISDAPPSIIKAMRPWRSPTGASSGVNTASPPSWAGGLKAGNGRACKASCVCAAGRIVAASRVANSPWRHTIISAACWQMPHTSRRSSADTGRWRTVAIMCST